MPFAPRLADDPAQRIVSPNSVRPPFPSIESPRIRPCSVRGAPEKRDLATPPPATQAGSHGRLWFSAAHCVNYTTHFQARHAMTACCRFGQGRLVMARSKKWLIYAVALLTALVLAGIGVTKEDLWDGGIAVSANDPPGKPDGDRDYVQGLADLGILKLPGYEPRRGSSD
jgi:hypothetical protein